MAGHIVLKISPATLSSASLRPTQRSQLATTAFMAVKSGVGVAPLPTTIADMHDDLVRVLPPVRELTRGWYLLTHPDLRTTPSIRAFFDFVVEKRDLVRPILMG